MYTLEESKIEYPHNPLVTYQHNDKKINVIQEGKVIATAIIEVKESEAYLFNIEVFDKRKGHGRKIIKQLMEHFNLELLKGASSSTFEAYLFWQSLGAEFYFVKEEGFTIEELVDAEIESPFILMSNEMK